MWATFIQKQQLKSVTLTYIGSLGWQKTKLSTLYRAVFVMLELRYTQSITTAVLSLRPCLSYFIRHFILVWRVCLKPIIFALYAHQQPFILLLSIMGLVFYAFFWVCILFKRPRLFRIDSPYILFDSWIQTVYCVTRDLFSSFNNKCTTTAPGH